MMISYWTGFLIYIGIAILIIYSASLVAKKLGKQGAAGGLIGFFLGIGFIFFMLFSAGRLYVVTGNEEFSDYLVYGTQKYTLKDGKEIEVIIEGSHCMVINDWEKPVIVQHVQYGGMNFGDETTWIHPQKGKVLEGNKIFYFFEDGPPKEISVKTDDDKVFRLWLRNKRD